MRNRVFGWVTAIATCGLVVLLAPMPAAGQALYSPDAKKDPGARSWAAEREKLPPFTPPRTPEGTPDLRGRWGGTPGGDDMEEHGYIDLSTPPEESFISDPPDGKIPYQPWALAVRNAHRVGLARGWPGEKGLLYTDQQAFCFYTVPRATYRGGFEIVQRPGYVMILYNFGHYYRFIPTDGRPRGVGDNVKLWMGSSRGSYEGNTLVVDVRNLNAKNWLDQVGNFFSDNAHVVERFTLVAPNIIDYEVTIEDAKVFTRPWKVRLPLRRAGAAAGDPYADETWENACHEGNRAPEHLRERGYKWFGGVVPPN